MLEDLEILALGELHLTPNDFGNLTIMELDCMLDGYRRRYERFEDLLIINCSLPVYRGHFGKKAPSYRRLTAHRRINKSIPAIDDDEVKKWSEILNEVAK